MGSGTELLSCWCVQLCCVVKVVQFGGSPSS